MQYGSLDDEEYLVDMEAIDAAAQQLETFLAQAPVDRVRNERLIGELSRDIATEAWVAVSQA